MAFIKQLFLTLVLLGGASALWISLDPAPGRLILESGVEIPGEVREAIVWLNPASAGEAEAAAGAPEGAGGPPGGGRTGRGGAPLVIVGEVSSVIARQTLKAIGTADAVRSVAVYPDATGIVSAVGFQSGSAVAAGDVLVTLQNDTEALALDRARIAVGAAEEQVARAEQLVASRAISAVEVDNARRALDTARLDVRGAEIALAERAILAPIDGRVGLAGIDVGDLVGGQTLIATIDDRSSLTIVFFVPEAFVPSIAVGQSFAATSTARPGESFEGEIAAIDSRLDEASRTLRVEGTIANDEDRLRPGMSFALSLEFDGERYLALDPLAIQWERAGAYVWRIEESVASKAPIRIVQRDVDTVLVASDDLTEGDIVAVEGVQSIREGAPVRTDGAAPAGPAVADAQGSPVQGPTAEAPAGPASSSTTAVTLPEGSVPVPTPSPGSSLGFTTPASARETAGALAATETTLR